MTTKTFIEHWHRKFGFQMLTKREWMATMSSYAFYEKVEASHPIDADGDVKRTELLEGGKRNGWI